MSIRARPFRWLAVLRVASLWLVPGGLVLGIFLSEIYGAHGAGLVLVGGGTLGLVAALVNVSLLFVPAFRNATAGWRALAVFIGGLGLCAASMIMFFGAPAGGDLAWLGVVVLGLSAAFVRAG